MVRMPLCASHFSSSQQLLQNQWAGNKSELPVKGLASLELIHAMGFTQGPLAPPYKRISSDTSSRFIGNNRAFQLLNPEQE